MDNEFQHLWAMVSTLSVGALKCIAHLLPLLCLLHFIINTCNKCLTFTLIVINGNDDPRLFFDSSAAHLFIFSSVRQDKNRIIHCFVFHVWRIYCELMLHLPHDTCMVRMSLLC